MTTSSSTPVPTPTNFVFLKNPSARLLATLGKTEKDLEPDDVWKRENCRWLNLPALSEGVEIYYGLDSTYLLEEHEEEVSIEEIPETPLDTVPFISPEIPTKHSKAKRKTWKKRLVS